MKIDTKDILREEFTQWLNPWPTTLWGGLEKVWIVELSNGKKIPFNCSEIDEGFVGLACVKEGSPQIDNWINPNQIIDVRLATFKERKDAGMIYKNEESQG